MNLLEFNFDSSFLMSRIPYRLESCEYRGEISEGIQRFDIVRDGQESCWLVAQILRREEDLVWKSCQELLTRTMKEAAASLRGFYGFDLIMLEFGDSLRTFQWDNLRQLLMNHARTLNPGEEKLIQYTSLFGILKKRINEEWGKIDYSWPLKIYPKTPEQFDLFVKKIVNEAQALEKPFKVMICDLSQDAIVKLSDDVQSERLTKFFENIRTKGEPVSEVFYFQSRSTFELGSQFGFRDRHV